MAAQLKWGCGGEPRWHQTSRITKVHGTQRCGVARYSTAGAPGQVPICLACRALRTTAPQHSTSMGPKSALRSATTAILAPSKPFFRPVRHVNADNPVAKPSFFFVTPQRCRSAPPSGTNVVPNINTRESSAATSHRLDGC